MMTTPTTRRQLTFLASALALAAIIGGVLFWQLLPQDRTVSAQAALEDACASVSSAVLELPTFLAFDVFERSTMTQGDREVTTTSEKNIAGTPHYQHHEVQYWEDGTPYYESFVVVRSGVASGSSGRSSDGNAQETYALVSYHRSINEQGAWEDWKVQSQPIEANPSQDSGSGTRNAAAASATMFCGMNVDEKFTSFRYVGEEDIYGVRTKHFIGLDDLYGAEDPDFIQYEYWIALTGFPVQFKVNRRMDLGGQFDELVTVTTYSGWGEQNVINPPTQETSPAATPVPTAPVPPTLEPTKEPSWSQLWNPRRFSARPMLGWNRTRRA